MFGIRITISTLLIFILQKDLVLAGSLSRTVRQSGNNNNVIEKNLGEACDCPTCACIPYYQCANGAFNVGGVGLLDIR